MGNVSNRLAVVDHKMIFTVEQVVHDFLKLIQQSVRQLFVIDNIIVAIDAIVVGAVVNDAALVVHPVIVAVVVSGNDRAVVDIAAEIASVRSGNLFGNVVRAVGLATSGLRLDLAVVDGADLFRAARLTRIAFVGIACLGITGLATGRVLTAITVVQTRLARTADLSARITPAGVVLVDRVRALLSDNLVLVFMLVLVLSAALIQLDNVGGGAEANVAAAI